MKLKTASLMVATLLLAACGREQTNSDGNGPGNADGAGGRTDPTTAPAADLGQPAPAGEPTSPGTQPPASGESTPPAAQPAE
jgi:hypothetical protein